MADIIDFPKSERREALTWQCACGSFSFKLQSDRSAVCNDCGVEAVRQLGFWQIKDAPPPLDKSKLDLSNVRLLRMYRDGPEEKARERALFAAAMQSPLVRSVLERGGAITICGAAPPKEGEL
jgi:hypothetical protein